MTGNRHKESRKIGWEYLHIAMDDYSRTAFSGGLLDQTHQLAMRFFLMPYARSYLNSTDEQSNSNYGSRTTTSIDHTQALNSIHLLPEQH